MLTCKQHPKAAYFGYTRENVRIKLMIFRYNLANPNIEPPGRSTTIFLEDGHTGEDTLISLLLYKALRLIEPTVLVFFPPLDSLILPTMETRLNSKLKPNPQRKSPAASNKTRDPLVSKGNPF